jgi:omega-amidase
MRSPTIFILKDFAKTHKVHICGSLPELSDDKIYNSCILIDDKGEIIAKHRKVHLNDVKITNFEYKESDTFSPGNEITVVNTKFGFKIGLLVCYDIRY